MDDKFEDYESEEEWIAAWPDNPCPNCGKGGMGEDCKECWPEG